MSASILTHTRFERPPVQQQGRNGRHPKAIVMLRKHRDARDRVDYKEQQRLEAIAKLKSGLAFYQNIINEYRNQLAQLQQGGAA